MRCTFQPYEGPEKYIFVSYSHKDGEKIAGMLEALNEKGFRIWYDEGIEWGTEWPESIAKHLHGCAVVMAFHSKTSVASRNCRHEINYALKCGKDILSVYLEEVELSKGMDMQLSSYQSTYPYQYENQEEFCLRLTEEPLLHGCRSNREVVKQPGDAIIQQFVPKVQPFSTQSMRIEDCVLVKYDGPGGDVVIPEGVTKIGDRAFRGCESMTSVTIPNSVKTIGDDAFFGCVRIVGITIPEGVTTIGNNAFYSCASLASVTIPNSVKTIGENAFSSCLSLTNVTIPNGVKTISKNTFSGCKCLTSVTIPESVTTIGRMAFTLCESLTNITIPESVTAIGGGAFTLCKSLTRVSIPENITKIGVMAFSCCVSLRDIFIPASVSKIEEDAFEDCSPQLKISTPAQSYAHKYAKKHHIQVELI